MLIVSALFAAGTSYKNTEITVLFYRFLVYSRSAKELYITIRNWFTHFADRRLKAGAQRKKNKALITQIITNIQGLCHSCIFAPFMVFYIFRLD